mmetsp:Transcript_19122/g.35584  ORF Transcript_19122/g.35584 Transcript_19122/m.35584 type:complete len:211 (-) Transcript_19122:126-758(-)
MPGRSKTIDFCASFPVIQLAIVDLPTLGAPTMAIRGNRRPLRKLVPWMGPNDSSSAWCISLFNGVVRASFSTGDSSSSDGEMSTFLCFLTLRGAKFSKEPASSSSSFSSSSSSSSDGEISTFLCFLTLRGTKFSKEPSTESPTEMALFNIGGARLNGATWRNLARLLPAVFSCHPADGSLNPIMSVVSALKEKGTPFCLDQESFCEIFCS